MSKNIILFADGTGNKGGYTPDSNVYKMYNAIEIHDTDVPQYTFYDNGVGTSTNKYLRAIGGAVGAGIKNNIIDLYAFLALNYVSGDKVYLFGFSRGAATIRALCGFIDTVGLVKGASLKDDVLRKYTKQAFTAYENHETYTLIANNFHRHKNSHGKIPIHFVGVWDTVSALGFPKRTDKMGVGLNILTYLFDKFETVSDWFWPHNFYKYDLNENIHNAYQALSIDDERTAFWPHVWNERKCKGTVEQVWFSGMHSNVGGGYERQGMANVTLYWMMLRAIEHGMTLKPGVLNAAHENSNIHGRLYNSRDGLAVYYRYHPRNIKQLCEGKLKGDIKIHSSVFERLRKKTANYTPFMLPNKFEIVSSKINTTVKAFDFNGDKDWNKKRSIIDKGVNSRKKLYGRLVDLTLLVAIYFGCLWYEDKPEFQKIVNPSLSDIFSFISNYNTPIIVISLIAVYLYRDNNKVYEKMVSSAEKIRTMIVGK
ncbi:MAG: DUF2235 domain-containing protein [Woeseiaceae bacterium]